MVKKKTGTEYVRIEGTLGKVGGTQFSVHLELEMVDGPVWPHKRIPMTIKLVNGSAVPDGEDYILRYRYNDKDEEELVKRVRNNILESV
ncbi:MAG TPA: hypothetical protein VGK22_09105 [Candidatus Angelobacter sp.]|jgi:hypothetical protein